MKQTHFSKSFQATQCCASESFLLDKQQINHRINIILGLEKIVK